MISPFIDREEERSILEDEWRADGGRLIVRNAKPTASDIAPARPHVPLDLR